MDTDYSKTALMKFLDYAIDSGLVKPETGKSWRVAVSKVLVDLSPAEESDVRKVDIDVAARKFANRSMGTYKPESLKVYQSRVTSALQAFTKYLADPASYKPHGSSAKVRKNEAKQQLITQLPKQTGANTSTIDLNTRETPVTSTGLSLPFPIRSDFLAQVVVPRDLTTDEAKRLGAFLLTLATDFKPNEA